MDTAAAPIDPGAQPGKSPPSPPPALHSAASAEANPAASAQAAMKDWIELGSCYHNSHKGNLALRRMLQTQGMRTIWDRRSNHPIIVEHDKFGKLAHIMVSEHGGERGTYIMSHGDDHDDPRRVIKNMGQGHPLRVEYNPNGSVKHMWIPLWGFSHEFLTAEPPSDDDSRMYCKDEHDETEGTAVSTYKRGSFRVMTRNITIDRT